MKCFFVQPIAPVGCFEDLNGWLQLGHGVNDFFFPLKGCWPMVLPWDNFTIFDDGRKIVISKWGESESPGLPRLHTYHLATASPFQPLWLKLFTNKVTRSNLLLLYRIWNKKAVHLLSWYYSDPLQKWTTNISHCLKVLFDPSHRNMYLFDSTISLNGYCFHIFIASLLIFSVGKLRVMMMWVIISFL